MKIKLDKMLFILVFLLSLSALSSEAFAYWRHGFWYGNDYFAGRPSYYRHYYYGPRCTWVPAHWHAGYWYPGRRICYNGGYYYGPRCVFVGGYWSRGIWYPSRRVCR